MSIETDIKYVFDVTDIQEYYYVDNLGNMHKINSVFFDPTKPERMIFQECTEEEFAKVNGRGCILDTKPS